MIWSPSLNESRGDEQPVVEEEPLHEHVDEWRQLDCRVRARACETASGNCDDAGRERDREFLGSGSDATLFPEEEATVVLGRFLPVRVGRNWCGLSMVVWRKRTQFATVADRPRAVIRECPLPGPPLETAADP